jgi:tRNA-2-methylthio-N6-dimethylallyladenosine synthase
VSKAAVMAPAVRIETFGCQMNVYDSAAIRGLLAAGGFRLAGPSEPAEVVLFNTCAVREHAEHRVISRAGELVRRRELGEGGPAVIGICGCMAERLGEELLRICRGVDLVVGVDQYDRLPALLRSAWQERRPAVVRGHRAEVHYVAPPEAYPANHSHLVTIHKGCNYRCTYCIVPATRGPQREKAPDVILAEVNRAVAEGAVEVTLLGQNVTAYRWDGQLDFAGLLRQVARVEGLRRIRFLTGHPRDVTERLLRVMAEEPRVCPSLHVPLQSGSDRILRRMKRLYRRAEYIRMIETARRLVPAMTFSSDFIVGFPGETESDFQRTLEVLGEVAYDQVFGFKYSSRPGTPAARLADDVEPRTKRRRLAELLARQEQVWAKIASAQVGAVWRAAIEAPGRRPPGSWRARTAQNRKVLVELAGARVGHEVDVRITGHWHTTFLGTALEREGAARGSER